MTWSLVRILEALFSGRSRTWPSRLPKMLCPTQLRISQLRRANIGASTLLSRVSPVLPSLPANGGNCLARGVRFAAFGQVGEGHDGGAAVQDRAGADVARPFIQVRKALVDDRAVKDVRAFVQVQDAVAQAGLADVVAADDES